MPDYGTEEVADHALMLLLALARRLLPAELSVRAGKWDLTTVFGTPRLRGRTLGLIGCGRIGTAMALRAKRWACAFVFYDPYKPDGLDKALGMERCCRLDDLLAAVGVFEPALSADGRDASPPQRRDAGALPAGAYVINTARGRASTRRPCGRARFRPHRLRRPRRGGARAARRRAVAAASARPADAARGVLLG